MTPKGRSWLKLAFVVALGLTLMFGVKLSRHLIGWDGQADMSASLESWMTPRYVARIREVPPEAVAEALDLARDGSGRRITLGEIAQARGVTFDELSRTLDLRIQEGTVR
ncbi:hypothetical protein AB0T83_03635 [Fluviibacterium sp. DFM31]|uniref:Uncharacterized protein n=1 Tax=Meridianimarinicoccus marinus TaxID=3231483 RepID=A0ABV3L2T1_9RHOB